MYDLAAHCKTTTSNQHLYPPNLHWLNNLQMLYFLSYMKYSRLAWGQYWPRNKQWHQLQGGGWLLFPCEVTASKQYRLGCGDVASSCPRASSGSRNKHAPITKVTHHIYTVVARIQKLSLEDFGQIRPQTLMDWMQETQTNYTLNWLKP